VPAHPCPICKKDVEPGQEGWPFCSNRCRLIDLGNWLGGKYVVPSEETVDRESDDDQS
jgi:endogenous inhibitor of DNA gyrase (YacG/DUF329 family)